MNLAWFPPVTHLKAVGRALIMALAERGRADRWLRLYWNTADDNRQAQAPYEKVAARTRWVRYDLAL